MMIGVDANPLLSTRPGGIEVYLAELVRRMPALAPQHRFRLYFNYARPSHDARVACFAAPGVEIRKCRVPTQIMGPLHRHAGLPVDWVAGRTDIMFYPSFVVLPQRHGHAVVVVHDLIPLTHPEFCEPRVVREFAAVVPPSVRRARAVIAVSRCSAEATARVLGVEPARIHVVANGIHEHFRAAAGAADTARRYGLDGSYVLFVGTHEPRKNLPRLIRAYGALRPEQRRSYRLALAGKGAWDEQAIATAIKELPSDCRVVRLGHVAASDLPALYRAASAFCFPSLAEGFGIPPLEAMASGAPVIAADIPVLREVLGDAPLWADPLSIDAWRDRLQRLLEDPKLAAQLRERGLRQAARYSWERCARETLAVFERAAADPG